MIKYWCGKCGYDELTFDAIAEWNVSSQKFVVVDVGEPYVWCSECSEDVHYTSGTSKQHKEAVREFEEKMERLTQ